MELEEHHDRVLDNCHAPVDATIVTALKKIGAVYEQTSWMRRGILRDSGAIVGILRSMVTEAAPNVAFREASLYSLSRAERP